MAKSSWRAAGVKRAVSAVFELGDDSATQVRAILRSSAVRARIGGHLNSPLTCWRQNAGRTQTCDLDKQGRGARTVTLRSSRRGNSRKNANPRSPCRIASTGVVSCFNNGATSEGVGQGQQAADARHATAGY